ncbi:periodic tryptophan protein 1 homolog [Orussus abietinus]|uniref:periodic tryptophan protein 1 homolog n=1 Tax=Orussus abietinus TaxID=222816 RepID=UPI00062592F4|nr:periodic tryptophan protein 1 homolog [Orussus abietinus]
MNIIPCTTWVRRGVAAAVPDKVQLTPQELEKIIKETRSEIDKQESDSENESNAEKQQTSQKKMKERKIDSESGGAIDEYDFDNYDNEDGNVHCNIGTLAQFNENGVDPLVTVPDDQEDSEHEDDIIKPDDNLVLVGHVENDASILEIFVYNESEGSFYCHHDLLLPSFPLCIEWLNFEPGDTKPGNLCAIGSMSPIIDVWDLDLIDCLEPAFKLGRKANKKKKIKHIGHKDAVLDIAWNTNYPHVLASGSADETTLLWDLENGTPVTKFSVFHEKVQSLKWHPQESQQLLTGCGDKAVRLFDCRTDDSFRTWQTPGEVERVLWNHFDLNNYFVSTDNGYIQCIDIREDKPVWQMEAHEKEITGLSLSATCPGFLISSSNDGVIKVWDSVNPADTKLVWEKKANLGSLLCTAANPDIPFVFVVGGDNRSHNLKIFDFREISEVYEVFKDRTLIQLPKLDTSSVHKREEMMDVTEDLGFIDLNPDLSSETQRKKKKKAKHKTLKNY